MNKSYRHGQILNVIRARAVHTQEELAKALRSLGIRATQVTLSRDIRELGLVKTPQGYTLQAVATPLGPDLATVARESLLDAKQAQQIVVLVTPPGHASPLAEAIDRAQWPEIVGTIAGDNMILVVAPNSRTAALLRKRLLALLT